eukprot:3865363-Pleurochrysis_carterae.AAC.1
MYAVRLGRESAKPVLPRSLCVLSWQVLHAHQLQAGVVLGKRQSVNARALGGPCCALCALLVELGLARLQSFCAKPEHCCALL